MTETEITRPVPPLPEFMDSNTITIDACNGPDLQRRVATSGLHAWLTLTAVGDTTFTRGDGEGVSIEGIDRVNSEDSLTLDEIGDMIAITVHLGGGSGTSSHGMTVITVDLDDEIGLRFNRPA